MNLNEQNAGYSPQDEIDQFVQSILQQMERIGNQSIAADVSIIQQEKRNALRIPLDLILGLRLLKVDGRDVPLPKPVEVKCKDISHGGVLLSSLISLNAKNDIRFALIAPINKETLYCWVEVVWTKKVNNFYNYGCRFVEMPELERKKLVEFVDSEQQRLKSTSQKENSSPEVYCDRFICEEEHMNMFVDYVINRLILPSSQSKTEALPNCWDKKTKIYFQVIKQLNDPEIDEEEFDRLLGMDSTLSKTILEKINFAACGLKTQFHSIKHVLTMLGYKKAKHICFLALLNTVMNTTLGDQVNAALVRGRFSELIASHLGMQEKIKEAYFTGLFSYIMDSLQIKPSQQILDELNLDKELVLALQRQPSKLTSILETVVSYELACWDKCGFYREIIGLRDYDARRLHVNAVSWSSEIMKQYKYLTTACN